MNVYRRKYATLTALLLALFLMGCGKGGSTHSSSSRSASRTKQARLS
ncbi:MAG: hypothetical protein ACJ0BN_00810 [Limisphaerales bacterium]|nr:hypothetical protein [Verrucomicrobiae bacterium]